MKVFEEIVTSIVATLWFSWASLPFAAVPPGVLAFIFKGTDFRWVVPPTEKSAERKVRYFVLALIGGLAGEAVAVNSLFLGTDRSCRLGHQACHDGQTG